MPFGHVMEHHTFNSQLNRIQELFHSMERHFDHFDRQNYVPIINASIEIFAIHVVGFDSIERTKFN